MTIPINSMVLGKLGTNGDRQTFGIGADGDPSPSLSTAHHHAVAYGINPQGGGMNPFDEELGETQSVCHQGGVMQVRTESVAFLPTNSANAQSIGAEDELSPTLAKGGGESGNKPSVAIGFKAGQSADGGLGDEREVSPTLSHKPSALEPTLAQSQCDLSLMRYIVRRLTPTEAERLMGLPDGWTIPTGLRRYFGADGEPSPELVDEFVERFDTFNAIMAAYEHKAPPKGKSRKQVADWIKKISCAETCPDSPRYKGCGNYWASNQPRWILTRLLAIGENIEPFTGEEYEPQRKHNR